MPRGSPFTQLCQQARAQADRVYADMHCHSIDSDGESTPAQLVHSAIQAGLRVLSITDHDCISAVTPAIATAAQYYAHRLTVLAGVELSARFQDRECHVLAYQFDPNNSALLQHLQTIQQRRRNRFLGYIDELRQWGAKLPDDRVQLAMTVPKSMGRRHLAQLLLATQNCTTHSEAFNGWIRPAGEVVEPLFPHTTDLEELAPIVRSAGGFLSMAHPTETDDAAWFRAARDAGVAAIEVEHPSLAPSRRAELRSISRELRIYSTG
ncbi:MAG: PHP domain-containing protein, partial [Gemmataceae bacterium]